MDAIEKIEQFQRFGSVLGLERMGILMEKLGNPQEHLQVLHVAGTNGKGSVCKYLYEGLQANGYRTGLFISPFIEVFNERIQLDGRYISDADLEHYTDKVLDQVSEMQKEGFDSPTEFEIITAVTLLYFFEQECDFVILEVGLGGRGDSTNIIGKPLLSIITSIAYDHMDRLGESLGEIAAEKAGIIKEGVPVVSGVTEQEAAKVIAKTAYKKGCILYDTTRIPHQITENTVRGMLFHTVLNGTEYSDVRLSMAGVHQVENAKIALTAIEILRKEGIIKVTRDKLYQGIQMARQPGRFEVVHENPWVILDGAHNEASAAALRKTVKSYFSGYNIHLVTGMLADKEVNKVLDHFLDITKNVIATEPANSRKLPAKDLCDRLHARGADCKCSEDPEKAYHLAVKEAGSSGVVIVAGSLYLAGRVREILKNE